MTGESYKNYNVGPFADQSLSFASFSIHDLPVLLLSQYTYHFSRVGCIWSEPLSSFV